jgi:hypothetical protein
MVGNKTKYLFLNEINRTNNKKHQSDDEEIIHMCRYCSYTIGFTYKN